MLQRIRTHGGHEEVRRSKLDDVGAWRPPARRGRGVDASRLAVAAGWKGNNDGEGFFWRCEIRPYGEGKFEWA
jgi:hypothetical protein